MTQSKLSDRLISVLKGDSDWAERLGWVFLAGLAFFFLATSWRKWPDPLIDFGRELYIPWRLAHGSVLYRDADDIYGPLSQYLNAGLFRVFGSSLMVLVRANLIVFAAILTVIYVLFRRAWGKLAAFVSSASFIAVFGFGQYVGIGNYNYAAPYSHEATHGMLVSVLLALALVRWVEKPTILRGFTAGTLLGLTAVLKAEFLLAGGLMTLAALFMLWRFRRPVSLAAASFFVAAAVLPTLGFAVYLASYFPLGEGLANASRGWLNAVSSRSLTVDPIQIGFLGFDRPRQNLIGHAEATVLAALTIGAIGVAGWLMERVGHLWERVILSCLVVGGMAGLSAFVVDWLFAGRCLLGLTVVYLLMTIWSAVRASSSESEGPILTLRLMIGLLAATLMSRMILNGRITQYGFYQAALAGLLVPAVVLGELPGRLSLRTRGRSLVVAAGLALFVPGVILMANRSQQVLRLKTLPVGKEGDRFYTFPVRTDPTGEIVRRVTEWLGRFPGPQTLVVLPEGEMINYLTRMPSPVLPYMFYSAATTEGREAKVVNDLLGHPPDWVVVISRDLREYGIRRYGEEFGKGEEIIHWVNEHYTRAASFGGDPLDIRRRGAVILRRRGISAPQGSNRQ